jgi:hypothetical protein
VPDTRTRPASGISAREAALKYAEDEEFARAFEHALQEIYEQHVARLARIQKRLGDRVKPEAAPGAAGLSGKLLVTPERVQEIVSTASAKGLTRGDIAVRLGINSRDARLTTVLRTLKSDQLVRQSGAKRAARYLASEPEPVKSSASSASKRASQSAPF